MSVATIILALVTLQRLGELVLARANTNKLMARGATEIAAGHYPMLVMMHAAWLISLWVWGRDQSVDPFALASLRRFAGASRLGNCNAWLAMDHAHHRAAGPALGIVRPVPLSVASELRGGRGRNRGASAGAASALDGADLHHPECDRCSVIRIRAEARALARSASVTGAVSSMSAMSQLRTDDSAITPWPGFLLMCLGMFMAILDIQVVATSLPTIKEAFEISADAMSWIQTAYLIAEVIAIPLTGLFTRVLTLRWLFVSAITLFTAASFGCAFSGSFGTLIAFRVVQGFAGGALIPAVFSAVFLLFPTRLHATATTVGGVVAVLAPTIGPVVGGWITETYSWHWLFLINVIPGSDRGCGDAVSAAPPGGPSGRSGEARRHFRRAGGGGSGQPRDRTEGRPARWMVVESSGIHR